MRSYRYATCDVFTDKRFGGNQLAVVLDAQGIADDQMQAIAREFNFSETTFMLPPRDRAHAARVRIFTPGGELPFAGHPTVGTAFVLSRLDRVGSADELVLEEEVGPVPVRLQRDGGVVAGASFSVPRLPEQGPAAPAARDLARVLGLRDDEVLDGAACWSCGVAYLMVPLASVEALVRCRMDVPASDALLASYPTRKLYPFARAGTASWRVRMFAPSLGVAEDPATGSAAASFAGWLHAAGEVSAPSANFELHQGAEIGRPSRLLLAVEAAGGRIAAVHVAGSAVMFSEGSLSL